MKKITTFLLLSLSTHCFAQNAWFVQAKGGGGLTGTTGTITNDNLDLNWSKPVAKLPSINVAVGAGLQHNDWVFNAGLAYLVTGYKEHYAYEEFWNVEVDNTEKFYQVAVPLTAAYHFHLSERLFLNPGLGLALAYTYAIRESGKVSDGNGIFQNYDRAITRQEFDFNFRHLGVSGLAQATFGYSLSRQLVITAGPEVQYMITTVANSTGFYKDYHQDMRNYALLFNAGIIWYFTKAQSSATDK